MTWLEILGKLSRRPDRRRVIQRCYIIVDDPLAEAAGICDVDVEIWWKDLTTARQKEEVAHGST